MSYKDIEIKRSYISYGNNNIANSLIKPALYHTKHYKRSVGFFSSNVFETILDGVIALVRNKGDIKLITSPKLSEKDIDAISLGYEQKEAIISGLVERDFQFELEKFDDSKLQLLSEIIARGILDIKIAVTNGLGDYHDKLAIMEDFEGNIIVFYGSPNSSLNGYRNNYEKVRVVKSWVESENESVLDEIHEFDKLWNGTNEFVSVYPFNESAKKSILQVIERRNSLKSGDTIKLRDYQEEAINSWVNNNYRGFYVMATGTGKTWTAIYSAKELIKTHPVIIVICAPYKHLVKQWAEDVEKAFPKAKLILVSSENPRWEEQINEEIIRRKYDTESQIVIISTISSFNMDRFDVTIKKSSLDKLLIVDEAHRFTNRPDFLNKRYKYLLGLSATPYSGKNTEKGDSLMTFFGGRVFNLPIEIALERKFLVPYNYYPIYVNATEDEESRFRYFSSKMAACFRNGKCIDPDNLVKFHRNRLRVISMAIEKVNRIDEIIDKIKEKDHFIVYCGDGHLFDDNQQELRHIQFVKIALDKHGFKPSQFTATENMYKRMELVDAFNNNEISALAAIRCLDEGINIPSIKGALILSSNDDYREFVQRRGRILRTYNGKQSANIYDVIVLPSNQTQGLAEIEFRRYYEYAKLAHNKEDLIPKLEQMLEEYGFGLEDVDLYANYFEEDNIDE